MARKLTLGVTAARDSWPDAADLCADMAGYADNIIIVLDTNDTVAAEDLAEELRARLGHGTRERLRVIAHPLNSDFAAQRNRVQMAARTPWVLHLDCDERLSAGAKRDLPGIVDAAEADGDHVIALTRRNFVGGVLSALYPDIQYRLLRRSVMFTRAVHEYPRLARGQHAFVHVGPGILHNLTSTHVERRARHYEAIHAGAGRPDDTALLRQPLESSVVLPE